MGAKLKAQKKTEIINGTVKYLEGQSLLKDLPLPITMCSLGDGSVTEGEVAEAFQMAVLHDLPILFLILTSISYVLNKV